MRRKHQRRDPLKTVGKIDRAMTGVVDRHRTDVSRFFFLFVVASDEAFVVRIDDVPVARIRYDKATFAAARDEPILLPNSAPAGAARDANVGIVLLRAVNVVRERIVHSHMIKLRSRLVVLSGPVLAAISGDAGTAITRIGDTVRVRRIDPKTVMISVPCRHEVECLSAINGLKEACI